MKTCCTCIHGGEQFKACGATHLHCEHPDEEVSGEPGWGTLRQWCNTCPEHAPKEQTTVRFMNTLVPEITSKGSLPAFEADMQDGVAAPLISQAGIPKGAGQSSGNH